MIALPSLDPFELPIHVQQADSSEAVRGFIEGFLAYRPSILDILAAAETDQSVIVQSYAAALRLLSESAAGRPAALAHMARAARAGLPCSERESLVAEAVSHWVAGDVRAALAVFEGLVIGHPRDLTSIKLGQYLAFNLGDAPAMLRLALPAEEAAADVPWTHGMLAFAYEQCHLLEAAENAARRALSMFPDEPWAQHALAHVMLTEGRLREGLRFMQGASGGWAGLTSFMRTHNWWHTALFHIELGEDAAALQLYDDEVWGVDPTYSQDQVGAVSLLARLELAGVNVGDRWHTLGQWLTKRLTDQVLPFLDVQYLYGLARAGRPEAATLLANIEAFSARAPALTQDAWLHVALPLSHALIAHVNGDWALAANQFEHALPRLDKLGGSHAQRELFEQFYVHALQRDGQWAHAQHLVQQAARGQPQSERLKCRQREIYIGLGLATLAPD